MGGEGEGEGGDGEEEGEGEGEEKAYVSCVKVLLLGHGADEVCGY